MTNAVARDSGPADSRPALRWLALGWLLAAVAWSAWIRVDTTLSDPGFDAHDARGILRSDPALLFYLSTEIRQALALGEPVPADFHADPRIQHPYLTDVPTEFPTGPEFLVAWADRLWAALGGKPTPLHVVALVVMAVVASLFLVGIHVGVRAATGSELMAALAVFLGLVLPANYRTIGFLLMGEDVALPLVALHLGWLARFARTGHRRDAFLSGVFAAGALSTWHASSFVLTLELGLAFVLALGGGRSLLARPGAWGVLLAPVLAGACVPVLRASGLLVSPAAALVLALVVPELVRRRRALGPGQARLLGLGVLALGLIGAATLGSGSYAHVGQVVWAKLRFMGRFPEDPRALSFDARLLWQGPFETLPLADLAAWVGTPLVLLVLLALATGAARRVRGLEAALLAGTLLVVPVAWMFARLAVLAGLLVPAAVVVLLSRWERRGLALGLLAIGGLAQAASFASFVREHAITWYLPRPARQELVALIDFVHAEVPRDEPILGDFVNSPALLAHAGNPIVLQPKYETDRSRRQAEVFLETFFHRSPAELADEMRTRFLCRYLLVDGWVLGRLSLPTAGIRPGTAPEPGTAAAALLTDDDARLRAVPGFELVYRGAPGIPGADYRLLRLRPDDAPRARGGALRER